MSVTIQDVADKAGVSKRTVSRVLNGSPHVNLLTKKKVEQVIKENGFSVNLFARTLASGQTLDIIGIITGIDNLVGKFYFGEIIRNIETFANQAGHSTFIFNLMESEPEKDIQRKLETVCHYYTSRIIKGFIVVGPPEKDQRIRYMSKQGIPGIALGGRCRYGKFGAIDIDNKTGAGLVAEYLVTAGHQRIAMITGPAGLSSAREREQGFITKLKKCSVPVRSNYVVNGDFTREGGRQAARRLLSLAKPPTAVFAANDDMAAGVYDEAANRRFLIPEDISVVGFDNINTAEELQPALTTVAQPFADIGREAARCLMKQQFDVKKIFPVKLVVRNSVKKIR